MITLLMTLLTGLLLGYLLGARRRRLHTRERIVFELYRQGELSSDRGAALLGYERDGFLKAAATEVIAPTTHDYLSRWRA